MNAIIATGGDADQTKAQGELASLMLSPEVQVAYTLKKGLLPVRGDIDLPAANDCSKNGNVIPAPNQLMSPDSLGQINDLFVFATAA